MAITHPDNCCSDTTCHPYTAGPAGPVGPQGAQGIDGADGTDGASAYTNTNAQFTVPSVSGTVQVTFLDTAWMIPNLSIFIQSAGYYKITSVDSATLATVENLGDTVNAAPTTVISTGRLAVPAGPDGPTGSTSFIRSVAIVTSSTTLTQDSGVVVRQTTNSGITTTLWPTPVAGEVVAIINDSGGANTIDGNGNNIDGAPTLAIADGDRYELVYIDGQWSTI